MMISHDLRLLILFLSGGLLSWLAHDVWDGAKKRVELNDKANPDHPTTNESDLIQKKLRVDLRERELLDLEARAYSAIHEARLAKEQAEREVAKYQNMARKAKEELTGARMRFKRKLTQIKNKGAHGSSTRMVLVCDKSDHLNH